jgi:hypothetical protein
MVVAMLQCRGVMCAGGAAGFGVEKPRLPGCPVGAAPGCHMQPRLPDIWYSFLTHFFYKPQAPAQAINYKSDRTPNCVPCKGRRRKKRKKRRTYLPPLRFFEVFGSDFRKYFCGVFGLLMQRNGQKRDKKNRWEKTKGKRFFFSTFSAKSF